MQTKQYKLNELQKEKSYFVNGAVYTCIDISYDDRTALFMVFLENDGELIFCRWAIIPEDDLNFEV